MGFLSPNNKKIVLALIIFFILYFLPLVPAWYTYKCVGCSGIEFHSVWYTVKFSALNGRYTFQTFLVIFSEIVISYVLSCLVIGGYDVLLSKRLQCKK